MIPKLVTFDCAATLVGIPDRWSLGVLAVDCLRRVGVEPPDDAAETYMALYIARIREFAAINRSQDSKVQEEFWQCLALDWLNSIGLPAKLVDPMRTAAEELLFAHPSSVFHLFDDVIPCLDLLDQLGIRAAVISNWDYSLGRVLEMFGILDRFAVVKASLVEGVEKPDPRLFEITLREAGFVPDETFHVGDHFEDDFQGAVNAGIRVALIDRAMQNPQAPYIKSLLDLPEAFGWTA